MKRSLLVPVFVSAFAGIVFAPFASAQNASIGLWYRGEMVDNVLVERATPRNLAAPIPPPNLGTFDIVIVPGPGLSGNAAALAAFNRAAAQWEAVISDPITVTINADLGALGPGIIGSASSVILAGGYTSLRNAMVADAADEGAEDAILASLPTAAEFSMFLPAGYSLTGNLIGSKANCKALGFTGLDASFGVSDGSITFSNAFTFDYDNSDGVGAGLTDFETVAAHEIGHALGFFSQVDTVNFVPPSAVDLVTLDLFRFRNDVAGSDPATAAEFTTFPRTLVPGTDAIIDEVSASPVFPERRMSTGLFSPFPGTDGRQASHWKADEQTGEFIGLMDPTLSSGVSYGVKLADKRALDLMGYDILTTPAYTLIYEKGGPVPNAGVDPAIPAGATWYSFGVPAIDDGGQVAVLAKWKNPSGSPQGSSGTGVFVNGTLVVNVGGTVPGAGTGSLPVDATWKSFKDPVLDNGGHIAFLGIIGGTGISSDNDSVVASNGRTGTVEVLAQQSAVAPDAGGATFKTFKSVSIQGTAVGGTVFSATLDGADSATDGGTWWLPQGDTTPRLLVREGDPGFAPGETIKTFQMLRNVSGSHGHGRGQRGSANGLLQVSLSSGKQAQVLAAPGTLTAYAQTDGSLGSLLLPGTVWSKMSLPSWGNGGANISVLADLKRDAGGVTSSDAKGIFASTNSGVAWEPIARKGSEIPPGFPLDAYFSAFRDPVNSSTGAGVAFIASAKGSTVLTTDDSGIWHRPAAGTLTLIAREGAQPPFAPAGAKWKRFSNVALPGGTIGPIFVASLLQDDVTITSIDDTALYGVSSDGTLFELVRENQPLLTKTVKSFIALKGVSGSNGVTHAFNASGSVVLKATFTDGAQGIVKVQIP